MGCHFNFWSIHDTQDFYKQLPNYKQKIHEISRVQIWEGADLKTILPILWQEVLQHRPSLHLRFFLYKDFDVSWLSDIAEITGLQHLSIETYGEIVNLPKLALFPNLTTLAIEFGDKNKTNLNFLNELNIDLQTLYLVSNERAPKPDLAPILRFKHLKALYIQGMDKNLEQVVSGLSELETLRLRSISKPQTLDFIKGLSSLKNLVIQLCGFENADAIGELKTLQYLQLWRCNKLTHLDFVSKTAGLQFLFIETLNGVQEFPDIIALKKLRRVKIVSCKHLTDFNQVAYSQSIQDFIIQNATQSDLNIFLPIIQNKHIVNLGIGYEKVATQNLLKSLAKQHGREQISVYRYPDFLDFEFE